MPLDQWRYGDPLQVLIREESQTCKGCKWIETFKAFGEVHERCKFNKPMAKRCRRYREKR